MWAGASITGSPAPWRGMKQGWRSPGPSSVQARPADPSLRHRRHESAPLNSRQCWTTVVTSPSRSGWRTTAVTMVSRLSASRRPWSGRSRVASTASATAATSASQNGAWAKAPRSTPAVTRGGTATSRISATRRDVKRCRGPLPGADAVRSDSTVASTLKLYLSILEKPRNTLGILGSPAPASRAHAELRRARAGNAHLPGAG